MGFPRIALAAAAALAVAAPAWAQADDMGGSKQPKAASLGTQIHDALENTRSDPSVTGALLRDAVNSLGGICLNVRSYQVFRRTEDADTLKVECADRPLYLVSIDDKGQMILSGGDSRVAAMEREDGDVVLTGAGSASSSAARTLVPGKAFRLPGDNNDAIPESAVPSKQKKGGPVAGAADDDDDANDDKPAPSVTGGDPRGWTRWVFAGVLATFGLLAVIGYSQIAHRARFAGSAQQRYGLYSSEDKDRMLTEAVELKPDFFIHPSGLFIVRGKRGKRRLFPNRLYAHLYWRWGLKFAQIR